MKTANDKTLESYEAHAQEYVEGTTQETLADTKRWIDGFLDGLPRTIEIIEIGSAFGRDALYIERQGYRVQRTDAVRNFVELLRHGGSLSKGIQPYFG